MILEMEKKIFAFWNLLLPVQLGIFILYILP